MPTITDIKQAKQSTDCFRVYVDNERAFELNGFELSNSGLRIGQEVSDADVVDYQSSADVKRAYNLAMRFLGVRPRSTREMADYLTRKGNDKTQVASVLERLEAAKLLNDAEFSASWIANRQSLRPRSKRRLEQELMAKGISRDVISEAVSEIDGEDELQMLIQLAEKKRRLPQYRESNKLIGYLARQGYAYDLIKKALERLE